MEVPLESQCWHPHVHTHKHTLSLSDQHTHPLSHLFLDTHSLTHTHFQHSHTLTWKKEASSCSNADLWETRSRINFPSEVRAHIHTHLHALSFTHTHIHALALCQHQSEGERHGSACMHAGWMLQSRAFKAAAWNLRLGSPPSPPDSPFSDESPCAVVDTRVHSPQNFSLSTAFSLPPHTLNMSEVCLQGVELFEADSFRKNISKKVDEIEWESFLVLKLPPVILCIKEKNVSNDYFLLNM